MVSVRKIFIIFVLKVFILSLQNSLNAEPSVIIDRYEKSDFSDPLKTLLKFESNDPNRVSKDTFNLGIMHLKRNLSKALIFFNRAGMNGLAEAQFNSAVYQSEKYSNNSNTTKMIKWYTLAAKQNYGPALFNLAVYFDKRPQEEAAKKSLKYYELAANVGYAPALTNLGVIKAHGIQVKKDIKAGIDLLTKAAEQNYISSYFNLGVAYEELAHTKKIPIYEVYALRWYKQAALKGHLKSIQNLGFMLESATGTNKDLELAHMWINISIGILCSRDRLKCRWAEKLFKGPSLSTTNHLWDFRIKIERQLTGAQIKKAHKRAKDLISNNAYIKKQMF